MDVRRLLAQLSNGLLAVLLPQRRAAVAADAARASTGAPVALATPATAPARRRIAIVSWLEDGRQLRLRPAKSGRTESGTHLDAAVAPYEARRPRPGVAAVPGTPALWPGSASANLAASESVPHVLASTSAAATPSPSTPPPDISVDFTGELSADSLAAIEGMDATQRRLVFLRYLVRQGVYNEGFNERILPEQYWRSRGVDGPASEQ
jgi:hypothetical protein